MHAVVFSDTTRAVTCRVRTYSKDQNLAGLYTVSPNNLPRLLTVSSMNFPKPTIENTTNAKRLGGPGITQSRGFRLAAG